MSNVSNPKNSQTTSRFLPANWQVSHAARNNYTTCSIIQYQHPIVPNMYLTITQSACELCHVISIFEFYIRIRLCFNHSYPLTLLPLCISKPCDEVWLDQKHCLACFQRSLRCLALCSSRLTINKSEGTNKICDFLHNLPIPINSFNKVKGHNPYFYVRNESCASSVRPRLPRVLSTYNSGVANPVSQC